MDKTSGYGPDIAGSNPAGGTIKILIVRKRNYMTNAEKKMLLETRLKSVKARGKSEDCPGVVKKLERQIRNLNK